MRRVGQSVIFRIFIFLLLTGSPLAAIGATISGTITLDAGGVPGIDTIRFNLFNKGFSASSACEAISTSSTVFYDTSNGSYILSGVMAGDYYVLVDGLSAVNLVPEWAAGLTSVVGCENAISITVPDDTSDLSNYDFQLGAGGTITGVVSNETETAVIGNVTVSVYRNDNGVDGCSQDSKFMKEVMSAADGTFMVTGVPFDTPIFVMVDGHGGVNYQRAWYLSPTASVEDCLNAVSLTSTAVDPSDVSNFFLKTASVITGTVGDTDGAVMADGVLFYLDRISDVSAPCTIDSGWNWWLRGIGVETDGSYSIQGVPPGTYRLQASPLDYSYLSEYWAEPKSVYSCEQAEIITVIGSGEVHAGKDFQLDLGSTITGTVTDSNGDPVAGLYMNVYSYTSCAYSGGSWEGSGVTDANGVYTVSNLPMGKHSVFTIDMTGTYLDEYWNNAYDRLLETPVVISLPNEVVESIDFQLDFASMITGTVVKDDFTSLTAEDLSHLRATAYPDDGNPCLFVDGRSGVVNADGTYSVASLPAGDYKVMISSDGAVNYMPGFSVGSTSVLQCNLIAGAVTIATEGATVGGVNFQLSGGATIQGKVSRDDAVAFTGNDFVVTLWVFDADPLGDICGKGASVGMVPVAADGSYTIAGLPLGMFSVYVSTHPWYSEFPDVVEEWSTGDSLPSTADCGQAEVIGVGAPGALYSGRNFQVAFGGKVSGQILEYDGITVNTDDYVVRFHATCDVNDWYHETMNECGRYTSPAMVAGDYYVSLVKKDTETSMGWLSQSGKLVSDCAESRTVTILTEQTLPGINCILKRGGMTLVPMYMLLLNSSTP